MCLISCLTDGAKTEANYEDYGGWLNAAFIYISKCHLVKRLYGLFIHFRFHQKAADVATQGRLYEIIILL